MGKRSEHPAARTEAEAREQRLKAALKANLARRKAQSRARQADETEDDETEDDGTDKDEATGSGPAPD
ncbi:hypothetical protein [Oceaniglobus roseus]|uniref:hypothetical protein n=1 Tax=Oceaniglobus roseus TaxID=1737570 RepID=UPI000C7E9677|nr:hypothetical protein [Kandeliimicrobium roseum]